MNFLGKKRGMENYTFDVRFPPIQFIKSVPVILSEKGIINLTIQ